MSFIPAIHWQQMVLEPWTDDPATSGWIVLMGFLVCLACGWIGNFLILRRMSLVGDAISHSVLPGLAIGFLLTASRGTWPMFLGALAAGILTTVLIEIIHKYSRIKQDAAIGISFTTLFAVGVVLISLFADKIDLDQECVLYGEIAFVPLEPLVHWGSWVLGPEPVLRMGLVAAVTLGLMLLFYKELLVSSFDAALTRSLGLPVTAIHYALMAVLSVIVVSAFESVGAILVIAMLIFPGATASLLSRRLPVMLAWSALLSLLYALSGFHLALWLDCSIAGAMVMMALFWFGVAWIITTCASATKPWMAKTESAEVS